MKLKVSELTGPALDWAVAKAEGWKEYEDDEVDGKVFRRSPRGFRVDHRVEDEPFSELWALAGPIIEREEIAVGKGREQWAAFSSSEVEEGMLGPTPLVAAMRCYVASKLGDVVEVPEELLS